MKKTDRVGLLRNNLQNEPMQIIRYINNKKVLVSFINTGEEVWATYRDFTRGRIYSKKSSHYLTRKLKISCIAFVVSALAILTLLGYVAYNIF